MLLPHISIIYGSWLFFFLNWAFTLETQREGIIIIHKAYSLHWSPFLSLQRVQRKYYCYLLSKQGRQAKSPVTWTMLPTFAFIIYLQSYVFCLIDQMPGFPNFLKIKQVFGTWIEKTICFKLRKLMVMKNRNPGDMSMSMEHMKQSCKGIFCVVPVFCCNECNFSCCVSKFILLL